MLSIRPTRRTSALVIAVVAMATRADAGAVDLGTLGRTSSLALGINDVGQVVGTFYNSDEYEKRRAFLYSGGAMVDLGTLGGDLSEPSYPDGINNAGEVVGGSHTALGDTHAFLYAAGAMIDLGTLGGAGSIARAINESGDIVGAADTSSGEDHAFIYSNGLMTDLGTLGGGYSVATAINEAGQVVGESRTASGEFHAFVYSGGVMSDLGTLGGDFSSAVAINDAGQIVGRSRTASGEFHAFLYSSGTMTDLGALDGTYSNPTDINEAGQIVGIWSGGGFLYSDGAMIDLGGLVRGRSSAPRAISDAGVVVGEAWLNGPNGGYVGRPFIYQRGTMVELGTLVSGDGDRGHATAINSVGQIAGTSQGTLEDARAFLTERTLLACPPTPVPSCTLGPSSSLTIRGSAGDPQARMTWKWANGATIDVPDLGSPTSTTGYALCIYDSVGGIAALAGSARLGLNLPYWVERSARGWVYKERSGFEDGIVAMQLTAGTDGRPHASIVTANERASLPPPASATAYFAQQPRLTVQLHNDTTATCWTSEFETAAFNDATRFKAKSR